MRNLKLLAIVTIAFLAGTISMSTMGYATGDKPDPIVQAINNLANIIQNKQTNVNVNVPPSQIQLVNEDHLTLSVAATKTGDVFIPNASEVLFYGNTLCVILADSPSLLLEFAGDTIVQNNNSSCPALSKVYLSY